VAEGQEVNDVINYYKLRDLEREPSESIFASPRYGVFARKYARLCWPKAKVATSFGRASNQNYSILSSCDKVKVYFRENQKQEKKIQIIYY